MAWTSPMTAVANEIFTAAQFNENIRDNLLETAPAKAQNPGGYFVVGSENSIVEREVHADLVDAAEGTTNTSYSDLETVGPQVTVNTAERALVHLFCGSGASGGDAAAFMSFVVTGATSINTDNSRCVSTSDNITQRSGATVYLDNLNAGSNTFVAKYATSHSDFEATFRNRRITVVPL